jgi:hypothetical protein
MKVLVELADPPSAARCLACRDKPLVPGIWVLLHWADSI